ncbi:hypothetical protein CR513_38544, partial [Mucuna pruriens]
MVKEREKQLSQAYLFPYPQKKTSFYKSSTKTKDGIEILRSSWNEEQKTRYLLNSKWRPQVTTLKASKDLKSFPWKNFLAPSKFMR